MFPVRGCFGITIKSDCITNDFVWHKALICHSDLVF
jgi:hypothetical protein